MSLDIKWRPEIGQKAEEFFNAPEYKAYLENAMSFNRKLNEERRMRLPYIDSQTGVAQRHYQTERHRRERMPGLKSGQIYSYPQRRWRKKRYKYLDYFMQPPLAEQPLAEQGEMHSISKVENAAALAGTPQAGPIPEESSGVANGVVQENGNSGKDWVYYDDDEAFFEEMEAEANYDSDSDYGDTYGSRKRKSKVGKGSKASKGKRSRK